MKLLVPTLLALSALASSGCSLVIRRCSEGRDVCPSSMTCDLGSGRCVPEADGDAEPDGDADADLDGDADADLGPDGDADLGPDGDADLDEDAVGEGGPGCSVDLDAEPGLEPECLPDSGGLCFVRVAAGTFTMGSEESEIGRAESYEGDAGVPETVHSVALTRSFFMLATEVTQEAYFLFMGVNPSARPSPNSECADCCPVEMVTWDAAARFCNALSGRFGLEPCYDCSSAPCTPLGGSVYDCPGYRLPTEAEWEYAARACASTATYDGDLVAAEAVGCGDIEACTALDQIGWWCGNAWAPMRTGTKRPNGFGLFDMLGNVEEWVHDSCPPGILVDYPSEPTADPVGSEGSGHIVRGGGFASPAQNCRAARRACYSVDRAEGFRGFRVVRSISE